jgi:hypothetical protein
MRGRVEEWKKLGKEKGGREAENPDIRKKVSDMGKGDLPRRYSILGSYPNDDSYETVAGGQNAELSDQVDDLFHD